MTAKITAFLKRRVLPNVPYLIIFWFADKLGMAYRLSSGRDFLQRFVHSMGTLNTAMATPTPSFVLFDLAVGAAGTIMLYAAVYAKKRNAKKWRKEVLCCKGLQWKTPKNQGSPSVCGTRTDGRYDSANAEKGA